VACSEGGYVSIFDQPYHPVLTLPTFLANLVLIQAWNLFHSLSWNGVAWFVSVEFLLCLLFPLYLMAAQGGFVRGLLIAAAGLSGLTVLDMTSKHGLDLTYHDGIWRGMSAFAVGVGMAAIYRIAKDGRLQRLPAAAHSLLQIAIVAWLLYAIWFTGWSHTHRDIWTVLPMFVLVFALAFDRGLLARSLGSRIPTKLGDWSYAIFIGQTFWLQFFRFAEQRLFPDPNTMVLGRRWIELFWWPEPLVLVAVCIAWGGCLTVLVEQPAREILNRLPSGTAAPKTAASA